MKPTKEQIFRARYQQDCHYWAEAVKHLEAALDSLEAGGWSGALRRKIEEALHEAIEAGR